MRNKYWIFAAVAAVAYFSNPASGWAASALDAAESFAVIAAEGIVNNGSGTAITGDVGVRPGAVSGLAAGQVTGSIYTDGMPLKKAQSDIGMLYDVESASYPWAWDLTATPNLGGMTLTQGTYKLTNAQLNGTLTLDGANSADMWWLFLINGSFTTGANSSVNFINTLNAGNTYGLYWQVSDSATLGTNSTFKGNILAMNDITLEDGADILYGRALSRNGTVTLNNNLINQSTPSGSPGYSGGDLPWFGGYPYSEANPIPEPATLSLMGLGLLGLAFGRRKP